MMALLGALLVVGMMGAFLATISMLMKRIRKLEDYIMSLGDEKAEKLAEANVTPENKEIKERAKRIGLFERVSVAGRASGKELEILGREKNLE